MFLQRKKLALHFLRFFRLHCSYCITINKHDQIQSEREGEREGGRKKRTFHLLSIALNVCLRLLHNSTACIYLYMPDPCDILLLTAPSRHMSQSLSLSCYRHGSKRLYLFKCIFVWMLRAENDAFRSPSFDTIDRHHFRRQSIIYAYAKDRR